MDQAAPGSRMRAIIALNLASLIWSVGLGAAVPAIPLLSHSFHPSIAAAGIVTAAGGLGRLLVSFIAGDLMDRFGKRRVALVGIFIRTVFSFLEGLPQSYTQLLLFRIGSGVGTAVWGTGLFAMTADVSTSEDRRRLTALRNTMSDIGHVVGPFLGGWAWGVTGNFRVPLFINGFSKLGVLMTFMFLLRETAASPEAEAGAEGMPQAGERGNRRVAASTSGRSELMIAVLSGGFVLLTYAAFTSSLYREGMVNVVLPIYAKLELGLSQAQTGLMISVVYFGGLLSALPTGYAVDRWGVRPTLIFGAFLTTLALLLLALNTTGNVPLALAFVAGVGTGILQTATHAYAIDLSPRGSRGRFFGINQASRHFATLVGPLIIGGMADISYASAFLVLAALHVVMIPAGLLIVRNRPAAL